MGQVGFPRGKLTLEAQKHLMDFLRKIVEQLLDVDQNLNVASDNWHEYAMKGFRFSSAVHWSQFLNQPFSPPPTMKIDTLLSIAQAKCADAGDHF